METEVEEQVESESVVSDPTGLVCIYCQHPLEAAGTHPDNANRWISTASNDNLFGCHGFSEYDYKKANDGSEIVLHEPWVGASKGMPKEGATMESVMTHDEVVAQQTRYREQIEELERQNANFAQSNQNQRDRIDRLVNDIDLIGQTLIEEAESREWCDEYDQFVDSLNSRLSHELPQRERYEVDTYVLEVTVSVKHLRNDSQWDGASYLSQLIKDNIADLDNDGLIEGDESEVTYVRVTSR